MDTRTFAAEIGTWLDSNRLDLQGQQVGGGHHTFAAEIGTWLDSNRLDLYGWLVGCLRVGTVGQCSTLILLSELDPFHFSKKSLTNKQLWHFQLFMLSFSFLTFSF